MKSMAPQTTESSCSEQLRQAIDDVIQFATSATKMASETVQSVNANVANPTENAGETIGTAAQRVVEQTTETIGRIVTPIAEHPIVKLGAKVPGIRWFLAALGQVDVDKVQSEVLQLKQQYPSETAEQLAHRVIVDASLKAGGVGFVTNFVPPLALMLLALDVAAVSALQAEMLYRIAAVYGFSLQDPTRRGEVLAIFGLSVVGSSAIKVGTSVVELIPVIGTVVGVSSDAVLLYSLGQAACQFYEAKKKAGDRGQA